MTGILAATHARLSRASAPAAGALALVALAVVGLADYLTGSELSSSVFYAAPIGGAAWYANRRWALANALAAAGLWYLADWAGGVRYSLPWIGVWNAGVRLAFFLIIATLLHRLRKALEAQRELASTDPRTGLPNARSFVERVEAEMVRATRYRHPVTLAYLDLDGFKGINDRLGHAEGDRVLEEVGRCLLSQTRATDVPARLGGDEFAVLFPETGAAQGREAVLKLRSALEESVGGRWPVGFSVGVVTAVEGGGDGSDLIRAADDLMYEVKRAGKGSVRFGELGDQRMAPRPPPG